MNYNNIKDNLLNLYNIVNEIHINANKYNNIHNDSSSLGMKLPNKFLSKTYDGSEIGDEIYFVDWDSTILYTYKRNEFLKMSPEEYPSVPQHDWMGDVEYKWCVTPENKHRLKYIPYIKTDNKTHLLIKPIFTELAITPRTAFINFKQNCSEDVIINWGDGTSDTVNVQDYTSMFHIYPEDKLYLITIDKSSDCVITFKDFLNGYQSCLWFDMGETTKLNPDTTWTSQMLERLDTYDNIPDTTWMAYAKIIMYRNSIQKNALDYYPSCDAGSLKFIIFPDDFKSIPGGGAGESGEAALRNCHSLKHVSIPDDCAFGNSAKCYNLQNYHKSKITTGGWKTLYHRGIDYIDCIEYKTPPGNITNISKNDKILVHPDTYDDFKSSTLWNKFNIIPVQLIERKCLDISIERTNDNIIHGNDTYIDIKYTALTEYTIKLDDRYVKRLYNEVGTDIIAFPQNPSTTDIIERELIYEYEGQTASITIQQDVYIEPVYATLDNLSEFELRPDLNPDPDRFYGPFTGKFPLSYNPYGTYAGYQSGTAETCIYVSGHNEFTFYAKVHSDVDNGAIFSGLSISACDFNGNSINRDNVVIGETLNNGTYLAESLKGYSSPDFDYYYKVTVKGLNYNPHFIMITNYWDAVTCIPDIFNSGTHILLDKATSGRKLDIPTIKYYDVQGDFYYEYFLDTYFDKDAPDTITWADYIYNYSSSDYRAINYIDCYDIDGNLLGHYLTGYNYVDESEYPTVYGDRMGIVTTNKNLISAPLDLETGYPIPVPDMISVNEPVRTDIVYNVVPMLPTMVLKRKIDYTYATYGIDMPMSYMPGWTWRDMLMTFYPNEYNIPHNGLYIDEVNNKIVDGYYGFFTDRIYEGKDIDDETSYGLGYLNASPDDLVEQRTYEVIYNNNVIEVVLPSDDNTQNSWVQVFRYTPGLTWREFINSAGQYSECWDDHKYCTKLKIGTINGQESIIAEKFEYRYEFNGSTLVATYTILGKVDELYIEGVHPDDVIEGCDVLGLWAASIIKYKFVSNPDFIIPES